VSTVGPAAPDRAGIDSSHDPSLECWVASANADGIDFPIQNLPFGSFRTRADPRWRPGVAIGDRVLDLWSAGFAPGRELASLMADAAGDRAALRASISAALRRASQSERRLAGALVPAAEAELGLPCPIGDFTDFYVGIHHARAVGALFRPDNPLLPNYRWIPIGYHGRSSTVFASGHSFARPSGQCKGPDDAGPVLAPTRRLDFELELGAFIGVPGAKGESIPIASAEEHLFGLVLLNDWSARDLQAWEYVPLGPFLAKNFATTISPWIVTVEALAPFRSAFARPAGDPEPLPYLSSPANSARGAIDVELEVLLQTARMRAAGQAGQPVSRSGFTRAAYWTLAQLVAHHSVNGCLLRTGDLLGTGTLSGPLPQEAGSLLELTAAGRHPIRLANGEERTFLEDGDEVTLRGRCARAGFRTIGFGECRARVAG
jgi:fumarylacetoacetase